MDTIKNTCNNLNINRTTTQIAPPTLQNIEVNKSKTWNALTYSSPNTHYHNTTPPIPNYENETPLKFFPQYCFYMDKSFNPPKKVGDIWLREEDGYGIYKQEKNIKLAIRLLGLQNIFRVELMAIHHALNVINKDFPNEHAHIFTNCLNGLYVIKKTQIKHPTLHNNHQDKTILEEIINFLIQITQPTTLYKVRAHASITGNEEANTLAKEGTSKEHLNASQPHEFAHSTPYYYQRDDWASMKTTPKQRTYQIL